MFKSTKLSALAIDDEPKNRKVYNNVTTFPRLKNINLLNIPLTVAF